MQMNEHTCVRSMKSCVIGHRIGVEGRPTDERLSLSVTRGQHEQSALKLEKV